MGKNKYIESPEIMWQHFVSYKTQTKKNPFLIKDWVGKDANDVVREKEKPLTLEGFENWCSDNNIIENLDNYFANSNDAYKDYSSVCSRIRRTIKQDQIEGGMAGIYNPSITQRLNGLVERVQNDIRTEQPLFGE